MELMLTDVEVQLSDAARRITGLEADVRQLKNWLGVMCAWIGAVQAMAIALLFLLR